MLEIMHMFKWSAEFGLRLKIKQMPWKDISIDEDISYIRLE